MEVSKESLKLCQSGYPTLLVMSLPSEVLADDSFAEAFCLPIAIRPGGILLALPDEAVGPQAYAPNESLDADLMVGAVKRIEVALIEEGEGEVLGPTGVFQGVVVLDFADDILPFLREYDPSKAWITPFNSSKPTALPDPGALHELSLKWIASQSESSRVHFYSAQEDLEDPKAKSPVLLASTKKSVPPKRVTNTAIMDQLAMIGEQMKLLASRQDMVEQSMRSGGAAGDVQEKAFGKPPQVRLSDALVGKATEDGVPTMHPAKKAAMLSGPPPKVRAAAREVPAAGPVPGDPFHAAGVCKCFDAAVQCNHSFSGTSRQSVGSAERAFLEQLWRWWDEGSPASRAVAVRTCSPQWWLLFGVDATSPQANESREAAPQVRSRSGWDFPLGLFGTSWRLQRPEGPWSHYVDCCTHSGLSFFGRCCWGEGTRRTAHCELGTGGSRWWLGDSIFADTPGRAPSGSVSGKALQHQHARQAVRTIGASFVGSNLPCLCSRDGTPQQQKEGEHNNQAEERQARSRQPIASAQATVSEEAKSSWGSSWAVSGKKTQLHSGLLPEPCMSPCSAASGDHDAVQAGIRPAGTNISANELYRDASNRTLSFHLWCSELLRLVLRSRTSFSAFVIKAIRLPRDDTISTSAIYPVPLPHPEAFRRMPPGCSSKKRRQIHFLRAVNLVVLALDFWALDGKITDLNLLGRRLNIAQKAVVSRVRSLMLADGPDVTGTLTSSGRKFPQLVARLSELSGKVTELGVGAGPYSKVFQGVEVPLTVDSPELVPYRSLDSSRLKLTGTGHWDATTYLNDELAMVYRYPDILLLDRVPRDDEYPKFHDDAGEVGRLARLWDSRGLLFIHQVNFKQHVPHEAVRVFNNYKAVDCDRQIGDRRGRNAVEARVCGPSATLPGGADLADLWLSPKLHRFSVNITDRSIFTINFGFQKIVP